jgi:hypothetical protein
VRLIKTAAARAVTSRQPFRRRTQNANAENKRLAAKSAMLRYFHRVSLLQHAKNVREWNGLVTRCPTVKKRGQDHRIYECGTNIF